MKFTYNKIDQEGRGTTHITEFNKPFKVARFFYITNVPKDAIRGNHANKKTNQILICTSGKVEITVKKNYSKGSIILSEGESFFLPKRIWVEMKFLKKASKLLVLADQLYNKNEYITDINEL